MMTELDLLGRVLFAAGLSGVIGLEREFHGRPAGLRTHILVGSGAALAMVSASAFSGLDPARLAAGIITGIGFLGAGTIMRGENWVRGLTTAASIWFVATVGIVTGVGLWILASGGTALGLIVLEGVDYLEHRITSTVSHTLMVVIAAPQRAAVRAAVLTHCQNQEVRTRVIGEEWDKPAARVTLRVQLRHREGVEVTPIAEKLAALPGVERVEISG